jgi:Fe-S cluster biogenesis protein NfuA
MDEQILRSEVEALDRLLAGLEETPDGEARERALEAVAGLLRLYGEALRRIVTVVSEFPGACERLRGDELVSHLLLLHDLHPATLEERVACALETVRPYLDSHGGGIELAGIEDGVARVRLQGSCDGCRASAQTLELAVEEAVLAAAPELRAVESIDDDVAPTGPLGTLLPMAAPTGASPVLPVLAGSAPGAASSTGRPSAR